MESLRTLFLNENKIQIQHPCRLRGLEGLETLVLNSNVIGAIDRVQFAGLENLKHLDLSINVIRSLSNVSFIGLDSLTTLNLAFNQITSISKISLHGLDNLSSLNLQSNFISDMRFKIEGLRNLRKINLACNQIVEFDLNPNVNKTQLIVSYDFSSSQGFNGCKQVKLARQTFISYWFVEDVNFQSLNENLDYFHRKTVWLPNKRSLNFYQSIPVLPRQENLETRNNGQSGSWNVSLFFELYRRSKLTRLLVGNYQDYEEFISRNRYLELSF